MTYASSEARKSYRHEKIALHPHLCTACFKNDRLEGKKTCQTCSDHSKKQYIKHKDAYKERSKIDRSASPKRNIARMVSFAKKSSGGDITTDDIFQMWIEQDGRCALSGVKMTWGGGKLQPNTLSMDRINPEQGYFVGNIRLVCHAVNMFRGQMNDAALLELAEAICATLKGQIK